MPITNLDVIPKERIEILQSMVAAIREDNQDDFQQSFSSLSDLITAEVLADVEEYKAQMDAGILAQRGVRQLTSQERAYYEQLTKAMQSNTPKQSLANMEVVLPKTVIDAVFENIREQHPLLEAINFQNTGALIEILMSTTSGVGGWGELCDPIDKEISGAFIRIDLTQKKAFAFMPVCSAMLDVGPEWLDRWVRSVLSETIAVQLETGIVDGDGKEGPIGTTRKLSGDTGGAFPRKTPVALNDFSPTSIGAILNTISVGHNGKRRGVPELLLIVSYEDYYTKVFPATTVRRTDGGWNTGVFPYPVKVVPTIALNANEAVAGNGKLYFFGLGTSKGGKIEYSDHVKFLEHMRVYRVFFYGNGRPTDENAFVLLDITNLKPENLKVEVVTPSAAPSGMPMAAPVTTDTPNFETMTKEELLAYGEANAVVVDGRSSEETLRKVLKEDAEKQ